MRYWRRSWQVCVFHPSDSYTTQSIMIIPQHGATKCLFFLTEQYDAFVKFTHDQLMRRFGEQPASCKYFWFSLKLVALYWALQKLSLPVCCIVNKLVLTKHQEQSQTTDKKKKSKFKNCNFLLRFTDQSLIARSCPAAALLISSYQKSRGFILHNGWWLSCLLSG